MGDSSSEAGRGPTPPGESRTPTSFRTNDRSSGLRGVGLLFGGLLVAVGLSIYVTDSYGLFEAATVLVLGTVVVAVSVPYYVFRDDERDLYVVNVGDERATLDVTMTPASGTYGRIHHRTELGPGEGTTLGAEFEPETTYTVEVAADGGEPCSIETVPIDAAAVDDESTVFTVEVGSGTVRTARYASGEVDA